MATTAIPSQEFVRLVANEMACGIEAAVERWMGEFENIFADPVLTATEKMNAVREVIDEYRRSTGKPYLVRRSWRH